MDIMLGDGGLVSFSMPYLSANAMLVDTAQHDPQQSWFIGSNILYFSNFLVLCLLGSPGVLEPVAAQLKFVGIWVVVVDLNSPLGFGRMGVPYWDAIWALRGGTLNSLGLPDWNNPLGPGYFKTICLFKSSI